MSAEPNRGMFLVKNFLIHLYTLITKDSNRPTRHVHSKLCVWTAFVQILLLGS
jgi:hypothetical protein